MLQPQSSFLLNRKIVSLQTYQAMKIIILLFAILISFGFLLHNTFSAKPPKKQVRSEYRQAAASSLLDSTRAEQRG
jgi:hypothetical protein